MLVKWHNRAFSPPWALKKRWSLFNLKVKTSDRAPDIMKGVLPYGTAERIPSVDPKGLLNLLLVSVSSSVTWAENHTS